MSDIEQKALVMVNEVAAERGTEYPCVDRRNDARWEALCRAIEQHEAFRQEVSDAAEVYEEMGCPMGWEGFEQFIIPKPKPDPLVEVLKALPVGRVSLETYSRNVRAALDAAGFEIREKNDG